MLVASIIAIIVFVLSVISHAVADFIIKEGNVPKDYKTMAWFRAWGNVYNAIFWVILMVISITTIAKLIWGG